MHPILTRILQPVAQAVILAACIPMLMALILGVAVEKTIKWAFGLEAWDRF